MALTDEQFESLRAQLQKKKERLGDAEYQAFVNRSQGYETSTSTEKPGVETNVVADVATGIAKSAGETVLGLGTLGRKAQSVILPFTMGETNMFDAGSQENQAAKELLASDSKAESVGKFVGDVAQFAIPSAWAGKATTGMSLAARMLAQGATGAGVQAAKTGDIGKDELIVGATNALMVPAGDLITKGVSSLSTHFPEWLVRPLTKQPAAAKLKGKDAAKFLVESGRTGTVDDLVMQTDDAMTALNKQIDTILDTQTQAGVSVNRQSVIKDIVDDINNAGGAIDEAEVLSVIERLAPQARGLLNRETLTLKEANTLRQSIDRTLGDRAFLASQLTFDKGILMDFANGLRETVKNSDETLRPLYEEYAKNITLKQALNARAVAGGGANSVGLYDLITGGSAFALTGDPVTALLAAGTRRATESAVFKTRLAKVFANSDVALSALERVAPPVRAAVLSFLSTAFGQPDDRQDTNKQQQ